MPTTTPPPESSAEKKRQTKAAPSFVWRFKVWLISTLGYWAIRIIGNTLRWEVVGWENFSAIEAAQKKIIYAFWHGRIILATYFWRNRGIVVMISNHQDGEYIAAVIRRFGYASSRGSSTRGGRRALVEMLHKLQNNNHIGFALDGPRGPRYIAKPGAIWLASKSGNPLLPFSVSTKKKWILSSWDHFQIPLPFTQALMIIGRPLYVSAEASKEELDRAQRQLQLELEELMHRGDNYWQR